MDTGIQQYRPKNFVSLVKDNTERIELLRQRIPWWIDPAKLRAMLDEYFGSNPRFADVKFRSVQDRINGRLFMAQEWFRTYEPLAWIQRMDEFWSTIVAKAQALVDQAGAIIRDMESWGKDRLQAITSFISGRRELLMARIDAAIATITGSNAHLNRPLAINAERNPATKPYDAAFGEKIQIMFPAGYDNLPSPNKGYSDSEEASRVINTRFYPMDFSKIGEAKNLDWLNESGSGMRSQVLVNGNLKYERFFFDKGYMLYDRPTIARHMDALFNRKDTMRLYDSQRILDSTTYAQQVDIAGERSSYNFCYRYTDANKHNISLDCMKWESLWAKRTPGYISTVLTLEDDADMIFQNATVEPLPPALIIPREDPAPDPNDVLESIALSADPMLGQNAYIYKGDGELPDRPIRSE